VACITAACARSTPQPPARPTEERNATGKTEAAAPAAPAVAPSPVPSPSPAYPGIYVGTPTPNPTPPAGSDEKTVESYIVQPGETLGLIAAVFGCTVDEVAAANGLADIDSISAGQALYIPITPAEIAPALKLVPDSEMVYGPAYIHFDLAGFVAEQGGYLASYTEEVEGSQRSGVEIVQLISQRFSVGPRVLLTLLELRSGWVTRPEPAEETLVYPLGHVQDYYEGLYSQLSWAAVRLNQGYYGWKRGDRATVRASGVVTQLRHGTTNRGRPMAAFTLEDFTGRCDVMVFDEARARCLDALEVERVVLVSGRVAMREGRAPRLFADRVCALAEWLAAETLSLHLALPAGAPDRDLRRLRARLAESPGRCPVFLHIDRGARHGAVVQLRQANVALEGTLLADLRALLPEATLRVHTGATDTVRTPEVFGGGAPPAGAVVGRG